MTVFSYTSVHQLKELLKSYMNFFVEIYILSEYRL